ncbi:hypothetical protein SBA1_100061 [Candidatus Sulfotelmatobacter kueseliae]|uniref:Transposase n=1 Tax=Candidatus Sulfotelmatobacter kueseliae TaxID=2042962 RepID=A0A2U3JW09_9BACT|nr:hypothetical protein SBA1_100061 [Candidatus Sulfotelmatobacter kueseliae]
MADKHATSFVESLDGNQRNALRVILSYDKGCRDLRTALNLAKVTPLMKMSERPGLQSLAAQ